MEDYEFGIASPIFNHEIWEHIYKFLDTEAMITLYYTCRYFVKMSKRFLKDMPLTSQIIEKYKEDKDLFNDFNPVSLTIIEDMHSSYSYTFSNIQRLHFIKCNLDNELFSKIKWKKIIELYLKDCDINNFNLLEVFKEANIKHLTILNCKNVYYRGFIKELITLNFDCCYANLFSYQYSNMLEFLYNTINVCKELKILKIIIFGYSALHYGELINAISTLQHLEELSLEMRSQRCIDMVQNFVNCNKNIKKLNIKFKYGDHALYISNPNLTSIGVEVEGYYALPLNLYCSSLYLIELFLKGKIKIVLPYNKNLQTIKIDNNDFNNIDVVTFIENCPKLNSMILKYTYLVYYQFIQLHTSMEERSKLSMMHLQLDKTNVTRQSEVKPLILKIYGSVPFHLDKHLYKKYFL